jgi:hypothetical protein
MESRTGLDVVVRKKSSTPTWNQTPIIHPIGKYFFDCYKLNKSDMDWRNEKQWCL